MSRLIESALSTQPESIACFSVHAVASPGIMPRVLELFAKRGLVPSSWTSRVSPEQDLTIDIQMCGMEGELTAYVAACLRQIVGVEVVLVSQKQQKAAMQR
jgi:hypothetical protein